MKAVVYDHYGPPEVLRIAEVPRPVPQPDEVLVKVHASTVNRADVHTREANRKSGPAVMLLSRIVSGLARPRQPILGSEMAGEVVEVGGAVKSFKVGDRVFGNTGFRFGCHAEYTAVPEASRIVPMPDGTNFEQIAPASDGALNALWCLREGQVHAGESVLVYGASGAIGTAGVQLAKQLGAHVTAVATAKSLDLMKTLGADEAIDYRAKDFTKNGKKYDVIFDAVGKHSFARSKNSLKSGGRYLATDGFRNLALTLWTSRVGDKKVIFHLPPRYTRQDMLFLRELMEKGSYRPVIDRTYPLDQVIEATRYVETEQKVGNVVLTVA
ncbi:MAG TPA: NAD(P)-dependent alcohol dehydrogenase [Candidatus Dormibacteraeota bacterium]|nr:NAD(P)-dependent alcohol dehydrogenase [Candidatus Dormibacteraeota bacterium]